MFKINNETKANIGTFIFTFLFVIGVLILVKAIVSPVIVNGNSMHPTFENGDILLCEKEFSHDDIKRGTIVVFKNDNTHNIQYIKRVIGLPGETVEVKDGKVYINNEELKEFQFDEMESSGTISYPFVLSDNEYFCLGDNRNHSNDSREIGPVIIHDIQYIVVKKIAHIY